MNMKKIFSVFLAFVLLLGIVAPCFPVKAEPSHEHTYGQWTVDTVNYSQSRTCSGCGEKQILHGTTNKAEQVTAPVIGGKYYLAANVAGTLRYFATEGSVTETAPYSLRVTEDLQNTNIRQITLEDPTVTSEKYTQGFQLTYLNGSTVNRIYCIDTLKDATVAGQTGVMDTGTQTGTAYKNRHNVFLNTADNTIRSTYKTNHVLVVKQMAQTVGGTTTNAWRMLFVPDTELANEGVYPVMLVVNHTHTYSTTFAFDNDKHWKACDCGARTEEAAHSYSAWSVDSAKGTQTRACGCGKTEVLHGTTNKAEQVTAPVIGGKYYLAANVAGTLRYFATEGSVTETAPYSLRVTEDLQNTNIRQITLEDPTVTSEKYTQGFQLTYLNGSTVNRIYCIDTLKDATVAGQTGVMDTGTQTGTAYKNRHNVFLNTADNTIRSTYKTNHVLVVKQMAQTVGGTTTNAWRMLFVQDTELANEGVYPVMLVVNHTHTYGSSYEKDETQHWKACDCGSTTVKEDHNFVNGSCVCGAVIAAHDCASDDGKWYIDGDKHYQLCGKCGKRVGEADHTYEEWTFHTANGTQSKLCTLCRNVGQTLHGTTSKAEQVTAPVIGGKYYLAANVAGTLQYFVHGTATNTTPNSLVVTDNADNAQQITIEDPSAVAESTGEGFQLTYPNPNTSSSTKTLRIHCMGTAGAENTAAAGQATKGRTTFVVDEVNGVKVLRKTGNNKILAVKYNATRNEWRMLGVAESELSNEGVYPAMLVVKHVHSYGAAYLYDEHQHWKACDCGTTTVKEDHNFVNDACVCGAVIAAHDCASDDGKWYIDGDKHYQRCGKCGKRVGEAAHTYDAWTFDTANGTQSKLCTVCENVGETLHGTDNKVTQVTAPVLGKRYYLAANVDGTIQYFRHGTATDTIPYSLVVTDDVDHNWMLPVTVEDSAVATEGAAGIGFQFTYTNPATGELVRIYCYNAESSDPAMDTGINNVNYKNRHTFFIDEVNGVKVIRKIQNNSILVVKYNEAKGAWRMLGVAESELSNEGVYPVMLAELHVHSITGEMEKDEKQHWEHCSTCDSKVHVEDHVFVKNSNGDRVCKCGAVQAPHDCKSGDGKWHIDGGKHYQLCGICQDRINEADHVFGQWKFDTKNGTQSTACTVCGAVETLYGTGVKGYREEDPQVGGTYYLAANVEGELYFFQHGFSTDTIPYSLIANADVGHEWVVSVTLEDPTVTYEKYEQGFQITYVNPTNGVLTRIYCMDSLRDATVPGQTGVMDTGTSLASEAAYKNRHNFYIADENGQKVIKSTGNGHVLAVKYDPAMEAYRMLGVPASEIGKEGVYPAMLMTLHEHTHTDETYHSDNLGHWFACDCGGKSNYEEHTVAKWTYIKVPTQTTGGRKTGTCTTCGGKAVVDVPPMVAEGYYYLTGKLNGKTYYFRDKTANESVEHTVPFSLMTSDKEEDALKVDVKWDEKSNTYVLSYTVTRTLNIYMGDVNGSTVKTDGKVDLGASATTNARLIEFRWDTENKRFYQIESGARYVMAFQKMTLTDGKTQAVRMLAVPESQLSDDVVPVQLEVKHLHTVNDAWQSDAMNHWQECDCGMRKNEGAHDVPAWKVEKKATTGTAGRRSGTCTICEQKVINAIPMLTDKIKEPANGGSYYLTGTLNGTLHYFCHTPAGGSVADTYPYSLYTDPGTGFVTPLTVKEKDGNYKLSYGTDGLHLYISADGVGITKDVENTALVDFQWDEENKVLYQLENGVKYVLVFKKILNNKGDNLVRITSMPLERALIDTTVAIARLTTEAPPEASGVPGDATTLDNVSDPDSGEAVSGDDSVYNKANTGKGNGTFVKWVIALAILFLAIPGVILLLVLLKNGAFGAVLFRKWNLWAGLCVMAAGIVLAAAMVLPGLLQPAAPGLEMFTIVANNDTMQDAEALAVEIYEDHGISLPVVHCNDFTGDYGIFLNVSGFNSYGGYKYSLSARQDDNSAGIYIDGTGPALEVAISKWTKSAKKAAAFPFGVTEDVVGYEWNTGDVNMTGLGFELSAMTSRQLYEGVEMRELQYESFAYGKNTGYAVIVDADADVELKVSAGEWDENTTPENPGKKYTVENHGKRLTEDGYEVLAITNAGFYDLNTTMTYMPLGMQIVDGLVKKVPSRENPKNTDNWFAQTADGKYVISNTDGYYADYETKLSDGVGGGLLLMENGKPCFTSTTPDYRTVVGITKDGDLVILTISGANYAVVVQAFMDMGLEMETVLNLDGGGSTTLHARTETGALEQFICETTVEREVADAIAIVKKK